MITIFEKYNFYHEFKNKFWYIKGDTKKTIDVLDRFIEKYDIPKTKFSDIYKYIRLAILYKTTILGIYFGFDNNFNIEHFTIEEDSDLIDGAEFFENDEEDIYQGELKIINDELVLDTLKVDTKKYNL